LDVSGLEKDIWEKAKDVIELIQYYREFNLISNNIFANIKGNC
jgi:hypothetical protein